MSELDTQPRNEATGQYTPSTEGLFGREAELVAAGFTVKKDEPTGDDRAYSDTLEGVKEAGRDLALKRANVPAAVEIDVDAVKEQLGKPPLTEARTAEQAARELSAFRGAVTTYTEGANLSSIAEQVDKKRAEILKANPKAADELGLSPEEVEAAKKADGEVAKEGEPSKQARARPDSGESGQVEGLDPVVKAALEHPQVRQAIQEELGKADTERQNYAAAVNYANQFAQASLVDALPELGQIPVENWEAAIGLLAQSDPERVQRALGVIQRVSNASAAQAQLQQQQAHQQLQQFVASTEREDARLVEMLGGQDAANAATAATHSFLIENGIPRHEAFQFVQRHPLIATAQARQVIWKAAEYDKMKQASKTVAAQPLPPVQRPGVSTGRTGADNSAKIASLQNQLANAKGDNAARIAGQIRNLKRTA